MRPVSDFREDFLARLLDALLAEFSFSVSIQQRNQLLTYATLLKHSPRHSFASWDSDEQGVGTHFRDSFFTIPKKAPVHFLDVGSGAGIPGIIYAIFWPNTQVLLLDSQKKRCEFLEKSLVELDLQNRVSILCGRAETIVQDPTLREKFDLVTARALAPFPQFLKYTAGFVRVGGTLHALRGEKDSKLLSEYAALLKKFHLKIIHQHTYTLNPPRSRFIFLFQKTDS
jgi:16S rRNA (guanine527-N7)-methyltransferase